MKHYRQEQRSDCNEIGYILPRIAVTSLTTKAVAFVTCEDTNILDGNDSIYTLCVFVTVSSEMLLTLAQNCLAKYC